MEWCETEDDDDKGHVKEESESNEEELRVWDLRIHIVIADAFCVSQEHE